MTEEIIRATLMGALPVAAFTFLILQWSIASGRMDRFNNKADLDTQFEKHAESKKNKNKERVENPNASQESGSWFQARTGGDIFHGKIMSFGGGFYGTMALLTYIIIESIEIWQFLGKIFGPGSILDNIGVGMIVNFFIESIMNFIAAMVWFLTLPKYIDMDMGWIWLIAAYAGYYAGLEITAKRGDHLWAEMQKGAGTSKTWARSKASAMHADYKTRRAARTSTSETKPTQEK